MEIERQSGKILIQLQSFPWVCFRFPFKLSAHSLLTHARPHTYATLRNGITFAPHRMHRTIINPHLNGCNSSVANPGSAFAKPHREPNKLSVRFSRTAQILPPECRTAKLWCCVLLRPLSHGRAQARGPHV